MVGTVVYPWPAEVIGTVPLIWPLEMVGAPSIAPPGCKKLSLGVKVYPLPELVISSPETSPLVTVALTVAILDPTLVGLWIITVGGLVLL